MNRAVNINERNLPMSYYFRAQLCLCYFNMFQAWLNNKEEQFCSQPCLDQFMAQYNPKESQVRVCSICKKFFVDESQGSPIYCPFHRGTSIEQNIESWLRLNNISYKKQVSIPKARTIVDFLIPPNIIIYCDGDYWHRKAMTRRRDKRQTEKLSKMGYIVYRLKEYEINNGVRPLIPTSN